MVYGIYKKEAQYLPDAIELQRLTSSILSQCSLTIGTKQNGAFPASSRLLEQTEVSASTNRSLVAHTRLIVRFQP